MTTIQTYLLAWVIMFIAVYASMWLAGIFVARNMTQSQLLYLALAASTGVTILLFAAMKGPLP